MTHTIGIDLPLEKISEICRRYSVAELAVFGSAARGELGPESDLDILVEFQPGVTWGLEYFSLEQELAEAVGRRVDLATKKWLRPEVRSSILRDALVVYAA